VIVPPANGSPQVSRARSVAVVVGTGKVSPAVAAAFADAGGDALIAGRDVARTGDAARKASTLSKRTVRPAALEPATFVRAAIVIECVTEELAVKRSLLTLVEPWLDPDALVVTNTSSLPLDEIAQVLRRPGRFAGLHFLHPAHLTGVVEVIAASRTDKATVDRLLDLASDMGKRPIVVRRPTAGFVWNRLQMAVLRECLALVEEGVADTDAVDAAVSEGLAPRWLAAGPLATADLGGIAVFREIARQLYPHLSADQEPTALLDDAEANGGFYEFDAADEVDAETLRAEALAFASDLARRRRRPRPRREG